jgi:preprotein translocase subunit YajC
MYQTLFLLLADGEPAKPAAPPAGIDLWMFLPLIFVLFYFIVLRPARRQEQERQEQLKQIKKNDKIITTSGIYATVVSVSDTDDELVVKVDDNTRLKMVKSVVLRNITNEETAKAAQEAAKAAKEAAKAEKSGKKVAKIDKEASKNDSTAIKTEKS